jgi:hypothetical protein
MLRVQPAMIGAAELCEWFQLDHVNYPLAFLTEAGRASRPAF